MSEMGTNPDIAGALYGQPAEYVLSENESFKDGITTIYRSTDFMPQVGHKVAIHGGGQAEIMAVEKDPNKGFKVILKEIKP